MRSDGSTLERPLIESWNGKRGSIVPSPSPGPHGNELTAAGRIASPLIADTYRLFASYDYANAHPPEGFVNRQRGSVGRERAPGPLLR